MVLRAILEPQGKRAGERSAERRTLRLTTSHRRAGRDAGEVLVRDLSAEGMLMESPAGPTVGETISVELPRSGQHEAAVVWSSGNFYGCRFTQPLPAGSLSAALLKALPAAGPGLNAPAATPAPLSARLTALRQARGWSMEHLADRLGVSRQSVWYWESAQREPKPAMLARIAKLFGVSERELLRAPAPNESAGGDLQQWKGRIAERFGIAAEKVRILIEL